ncbi:MAG: tetratricopeptide repeat protein [Fulvivirga sp.]|mgnify:CR=1 FL=1
MKLFGFNKKAKATKFIITETDRNWVEDNFKWLIQAYGYPNRQSEQILISKDYFPNTFTSKGTAIKPLIDDLGELMDIDPEKIVFEIHEDLRDSYGVPYMSEGKSSEAETEILINGYKLHIAKSITKRSNRLVFSLIYEFIKIRLLESGLKFDTGEDTELFIFLAGIYFGFGIPLAQNLTDRGRASDGFWETKWNYISQMPNEVMAFSLASYSKLRDEDTPEWLNELPSELRSQFEKAMDLLNESPSPLVNKAELEANDLLHQAYKECEDHDFEAAISTFQKVLFLTKDELLRANTYNNMGYNLLRVGEYEKSIPNFQNALQIESNYGYAYDNLGYALIQLGRLEEAKQQLDHARSTENNELAYSARNLALYYQAKNETEEAQKNFDLAFESATLPVDLLEFHYAKFLISKGETHKGIEYLEKAVEKGEPEAIALKNELKDK